MTRPNVDKILEPLKSFQRRTVDHAFQRLFIDSDSTSRFLVADEVGLGKTLVARGIIARAIDHLWDDVERIDIIYICSNASIARANLPKLRIGGAIERSFAIATRLTMLATELSSQDDFPGFLENKLNFVSFTPRTSFELGNSGGQRRERELLFHLLAPRVPQRTALMNFLQGGVRNRDGWRAGLDNSLPIESGIRRRFNDTLDARLDLRDQITETIDTWFRRYRNQWPNEARWSRNQLIGELRRVLAEICVQVLEPDLVILDEFQRFKPLIETRTELRSEAADLAQSLFSARAHDGHPVRTLLLSATPYKFYTTDAEINQEDHYEDFLATTRFLFDANESRVRHLECCLADFGIALKRTAVGGNIPVDEVVKAKVEVENTLGTIMVRTERVSASEDRDAMVTVRRSSVSVGSQDIKQYLAADALFRAVGDRDPMPLWKSAPYLLHFMRGYKFNERLDDAREHTPDIIAEVLKQHQPLFLSAAAIEQWSSIDPANAKLRDMVCDHLDRGLWRLLWLPPTLPYWPLEGPFEDNTEATKTLMFSAWNVVPDVVSAVLSYEAERRMSGGRFKVYQNPAKQQTPLLQFTQSDESRSRHRLLLLLTPCLPLADQAHPLDAPVGHNRREWVRSRVRDLISEVDVPEIQEGPVDPRWIWAAPLVLDPDLRSFLHEWRDQQLPAFSEDSRLPKPNAEHFDDYLDDLLQLDLTQLGQRPPDLVDILTDVALGSPVILALRCLKSSSGTLDNTRRRLAVTIADAFWSLFNQPAVISLIRQLAADTDVSRDEGFYWRLVLDYCRHGNLQAVLDEHWHWLWEQHSWLEGVDADTIATDCAQALVQVVRPLRSRVHARFLKVQKDGRVDTDEIRFRTVFALRFGHLRADNGEHISQDAVRAAFNSPFRPFVLTSTSIGQEGLDFHPWCHRLVHWNLPGNPVDLEQREGRVHRYKGHAVRRNVVASHGKAAFSSWQLGGDLWSIIFSNAEDAARANNESDLVPHWIAHGSCRVERRVPLLPHASEVGAFERLLRQLAAYRVVFGQPRQEELINLLDQSNLSKEDIQVLTINLSPP